MFPFKNWVDFVQKWSAVRFWKQRLNNDKENHHSFLQTLDWSGFPAFKTVTIHLWISRRLFSCGRLPCGVRFLCRNWDNIVGGCLLDNMVFHSLHIFCQHLREVPPTDPAVHARSFQALVPVKGPLSETTCKPQGVYLSPAKECWSHDMDDPEECIGHCYNCSILSAPTLWSGRSYSWVSPFQSQEGSIWFNTYIGNFLEEMLML